MQSTAKDVSAYLTEASPKHQDCLAELRRLYIQILVGYEEGMNYGMPTYFQDGKFQVAFASEKNYISLYIPVALTQASEALLAGLNVGKSCIRYTQPKQIDFDLVRQLLEMTISGNELPIL